MKKALKPNHFKNPFWKACNNDRLIPAMEYVYFSNGYLYATDAQVAIRQKISTHKVFRFKNAETILEGKLIHNSVFKRIQNAYSIEFFESELKATFLDEGIVYNINYTYNDEKQIKYFELEKVISGLISFADRERVGEIGLNLNVINKLYSCCKSTIGGVNNFKFSFQNAVKGILVTPIGPTELDETVLVIMPIRL